jgi:hypothetical protein
MPIREECVILSQRCQETLVLIVQNVDKIEGTRLELGVRKALE